MARDPFADMSPNPKRGLKSKLNPGRIIAGLAVIVLLTFVFAFYVPLDEAHSALADQHETLSKSNSGTNAQLDKTTQQLMEAQKERDELAAKLQSVNDKKEAAEQKVDEFRSSIKDKLTKGLEVEQVPEGLAIVIDNLQLFRGHEVKVHPPGRRLLCVVGKALKPVDARVEVRAYSSEGTVKNSILKRDYPTAWDVTAARAVQALRVLESCGVPGERLRASGQAEHGVGEVARRSDGQLRLVLTPLN